MISQLIFYFLLLFSNIPADRFNIGWNKKASGKGKDLRDFFRPMTRLRVEAAKVNKNKNQKIYTSVCTVCKIEYVDCKIWIVGYTNRYSAQ